MTESKHQTCKPPSDSQPQETCLWKGRNGYARFFSTPRTDDSDESDYHGDVKSEHLQQRGFRYLNGTESGRSTDAVSIPHLLHGIHKLGVLVTGVNRELIAMIGTTTVTGGRWIPGFENDLQCQTAVQ